MPATLPFQNACCTSCDDVVASNVPGTKGDPGEDGEDGINGKNSFTTTVASYVQPAVGSDVVVDVVDSAWAIVGQHVFGQSGGHYTVIAKLTTSKITVRNLGYDDNAAPGAIITAGKQMGPDGHAGADGVLGGEVTGDIRGTFPELYIDLANARGELITGDGSNAQTLAAAATNGHRVRRNSAAALGLDHAPVNLGNNTAGVGLFEEVTGIAKIVNGGTEAATANGGFNNLAPTTTRGDIIVRNPTINTRLAVGTVGQVLQSDGTDPRYDKIGTGNLDMTVGRVTVHVFMAKHNLASGTSGGDATSGAWRTRPLNVVAVNTIGAQASLAANQITLPAGTYRVRAHSILHAADEHRCGLWNETGANWLADSHGGDPIIGGPSTADNAGAHQSASLLEGRFVITEESVIELRYRCTTTKLADGLGFPTSWGVNEHYATVTFEREAMDDSGVVLPPEEELGRITEEGEERITEEGEERITEEN